MTMVITTKAQVEATRRQLPEIPPENVVGEPLGRDTAACVGLAAALVAHKDPDGTMVIAPADHVIGPVERFVAALEAACEAAERTERIITMGIKPTGPSEVYGYVRRGEKLFEAGGRSVYAAAQFREKPDRALAEQLVKSGEWYWNSGVFVWRVGTILSALKRYHPALHSAISRVSAALGSENSEGVIQDEYAKLQKISIDHAVLEKADNVALIVADFEWDDVGSWLALERHFQADGDGNVVSGRHTGLDTQRCIVVGDEEHLVGTIGVSDLVIINTPDATLVCHKSKAAEIKALVAKLKEKGLAKYL
jgi:mannose-1-phosphate guanylyltransferase